MVSTGSTAGVRPPVWTGRWPVALVTGAGRGSAPRVPGRSPTRVPGRADRADAGDLTGGGVPGETLVVPTDITDAQRSRPCSRGRKRLGPVDVLVANAGAGPRAARGDTDEEWDRMLAVNLTAPFRCLRRAVPGMRGGPGPDRGGGLRRGQARRPMDRRLHRQQARRAWSGALGAAEFARTGVTVNAVCPGYVDTPMTAGSLTGSSEHRPVGGRGAGGSGAQATNRPADFSGGGGRRCGSASSTGG